MKSKKYQYFIKGVTLIELVAVIAISAILIVIAVPVAGSILDNAKLSTIQQTIGSVETACILEDDQCEVETKFSELNYVDFPSEYDLEKSTVRTKESADEESDSDSNQTYIYNIYFKDETFPIVYYKDDVFINNAKKLEELGMTDTEKANSFDFMKFIYDTISTCRSHGKAARCKIAYSVGDLEYLDQTYPEGDTVEYVVPDVIDGDSSFVERRGRDYYFSINYKNDSSFGKDDNRPMIAFYSLSEITNVSDFSVLREYSENYQINNMMSRLRSTCVLADPENFFNEDGSTPLTDADAFDDCTIEQSLDNPVFDANYANAPEINDIILRGVSQYDISRFHEVNFPTNIDRSRSTIKKNLNSNQKDYLLTLVDNDGNVIMNEQSIVSYIQ